MILIRGGSRNSGLGGGGVDHFFKAWGLGAASNPPVGPGQRPGGGSGGEAPEATEF